MELEVRLKIFTTERFIERLNIEPSDSKINALTTRLLYYCLKSCGDEQTPISLQIIQSPISSQEL